MKKKYLNLSMIPYPSGNLHIGHFRNYLINDIFNKYIKNNFYKNLMLMSWDSFGTPAENKSILKNISPFKWIKKNINLMKIQFNKINISINWNKEFLTSEINYYKWNQWLFLKLLKNKNIYLSKDIVNWDPKDKTVLSNEQVINGKGWRSNCLIKKKKILSYYLKINNYKNELLYELKNLNWPKNVKLMQNNWLNKKNIINYFFFYKINLLKKIIIKNDKKLFILNLKYFYYNKNILINKKVKKYLYFNRYLKKKYIFYIYNNIYFINTGFGFINYFLKKKNEILKNIFKKNIFIKKYEILNNTNEIKFFKNLKNIFFLKKKKIFFLKKILINYNFFFYIIKNDYFNFLINYFKLKKNIFWKLKNWNISRQRYWGTPIPIIDCKLCKKISIPEYFLPVILPKKNKPLKNNICLKNNLKFYNFFCFNCKNKSKREIDTIDTFFDSSWYFLNYFNKNKNILKNNLNNWLPVNLYIGGVEHSILHLLYSRFIIKFFRDIKYICFGEPFINLLTQGMVLNKTYYIIKNKNKFWINKKNFIKNKKNKLKIFKGGIEKMSKSKNNGINPNKLINKYGSDSLKLSIISTCPITNNLVWNNKNINNIYKFLCKIFIYFKNIFKFKKNIYKINKIKFNDKILLNFFYKNFLKVNYFYKSIKFNNILIFCYKIFDYIVKWNFKIYFIFNEIFSLFLRILYPIVPNLISLIWNKIYYKKLNLIKNILWPRIFKINLNFFLKIILFFNNKFFILLNFKNKNYYYIKKKINNFIFFKNNFLNINYLKKIFYCKKIINLNI